MDVEVRRLPDQAIGERHLGPPGRPGRRDRLRAGSHRVEVTVGVVLGAEEGRDILPGQYLAEPAAFHLRQVPDQAEQRQRGRLHGPPGQLLLKAGALQLQCRALIPEEVDQHAPFVAGSGPAEPMVGPGTGEYLGSSARCGHALIVHPGLPAPALSPRIARLCDGRQAAGVRVQRSAPPSGF